MSGISFAAGKGNFVSAIRFKRWREGAVDNKIKLTTTVAEIKSRRDGKDKIGNRV